MATNTPNFSLPKPDANDNFNRAAYNTLIDAIDSKVGAKTTAADTHMADSIKHLTATEREIWNSSQLKKLTEYNGFSIGSNNMNLNNLKDTGFYYGSGMTNGPEGFIAGWTLVHAVNENYLVQEFTNNSNTQGSIRKFWRVFFNGTWTGWNEHETTLGSQAKVDTHAADAVKHITGAEREKWNSGQLFKLTGNDGASLSAAAKNVTTFRNRSDAGVYTTTETTSGLPPKLEAYERYGTLQVFARDSGSIQQLFINFEGRMFHRYLLTSTTYFPSYADNAGWIEFMNTGRTLNAILGNKIKDQSNANFVGKAAGSTVANPHKSNGISGYTSLISATSVNSETSQLGYDLISSLNGSLATVSNGGANQVSQWLFQFNLIEHVQRTYGTIPGTTADKLDWIRNNLSGLNFNWYGYGSGASGNKASVSIWRPDLNDYHVYKPSHTSNVVSNISYALQESLTPFMDSNGFVHFLAFAEASDGITPSVLNTDYAELKVELSTDIKSNIPNATQSSAGLQSGADKTKLDGISTGANKTTNPAINGSIAIDGVPTVVYAHPTGDGSSHVPATGTTNGGKVLKSGATANALSWAFVDWSEIINKPSTYLPSTHNHAITDITGLSTALSNKLDTSQRGAASGVASLGADGKVPTSQLPTIANTAADITIADSGNYFDGANVETGMQEIGRVLAGSRASLVASAQQLGVI